MKSKMAWRGWSVWVLLAVVAGCQHSADQGGASAPDDVSSAVAPAAPRATSEGRQDAPREGDAATRPGPSPAPVVPSSEPIGLIRDGTAPSRARSEAPFEVVPVIGNDELAESTVADAFTSAAATPAAALRKRAQRGSGDSGGKRMARATRPVLRSVVQTAPAQPPFHTEGYDAVPDSPFSSVTDQPLSTFSIDVDTASYSNVRRLLAQGQLPPSGAVRIEELVNYFSFDYPEPSGDEPFSVTTEVSAAPWNQQHRLLHVGLQGKRIDASKLPPRNLVFLLDVSGSMSSANKLPLLKRSLASLAETLGHRDRVAIVVYAGASGLVLPPTTGDRRAQIFAALDRLNAGGSTNGADGIELAYSVATDMARPGSINRVILATDGDFNVGVTSRSELHSLIEKKRESGVYLSVLGFGMGNYKDGTLEMLADKGNGNYAYIDTLAEARKVLVEEGGGTLFTLAKDVKLQIEFNPENVAAYRLIGYENRRLAARDFNDDRKDAGELGAGHSVTALYEIVPPGVPLELPGVDALKYQARPRVTAQAHAGELLTVKLRYKRPSESASRLLTRVVRDDRRPLDASSDRFRFSAAVAAFGMTLRGSDARGTASHELARRLARGSLGTDAHGYRREFIGLIDRAAALTGKQAAR